MIYDSENQDPGLEQSQNMVVLNRLMGCQLLPSS